MAAKWGKTVKTRGSKKVPKSEKKCKKNVAGGTRTHAWGVKKRRRWDSNPRVPGAAYVPRGVPLAAAYGVLAKNQFGLRNAGGVGATPPAASHCVVRAPSVL